MTILSESYAAWERHAGQVLAGEFDGCNSSTKCSLLIGLRATPGERCKDAVARLEWMRASAPKKSKGASQGGLF